MIQKIAGLTLAVIILAGAFIGWREIAGASPGARIVCRTVIVLGTIATLWLAGLIMVSE